MKQAEFLDWMDRHGIVPVRKRRVRSWLFGKSSTIVELYLGECLIGTAIIHESGEVELKLHESPREVEGWN